MCRQYTPTYMYIYMYIWVIGSSSNICALIVAPSANLKAAENVMTLMTLYPTWSEIFGSFACFSLCDSFTARNLLKADPGKKKYIEIPYHQEMIYDIYEPIWPMSWREMKRLHDRRDICWEEQVLKTRQLQKCNVCIALQLRGVPGFLKPYAFFVFQKLWFVSFSTIAAILLEHALPAARRVWKDTSFWRWPDFGLETPAAKHVKTFQAVLWS